MAREKKVDAGAGAVPLWMNTYADMVTLVLCFFVLLFSMSTVESSKWKAIVEAFSGSDGIFDYLTPTEDGESPSNGSEGENPNDGVSFPAAKPGEELDYEIGKIKDDLEEEFRGKYDTDGFSIDVTATDMRVIIQGDILFNAAKATLLPEGEAVISRVIEEILPLKDSFKEFRFEGHADKRSFAGGNLGGVPIDNEILSSARGLAVKKFVSASFPEIPSTKCSIAGYGIDRPLVDENTQEAWAKNRRVEIVLVKDPELAAQETELEQTGGGLNVH